MLNYPVKVVQHVRVGCLKANVLLDFYLKIQIACNSSKKSTYVFRVISEARAIGRVELQVNCKELGDIHHCVSDLMQPHAEFLFKERREDLIVVVDSLSVQIGSTILALNLWSSSLAAVGIYRLGLFHWLWDGRVDCELHSHLVVVGEHGHGLLVAYHQVEECRYELPRLELMSTVIDSDGIEVRHERSVPVVRVESELAEGTVVTLSEGVHVSSIGVVVPLLGEPICPGDKSDRMKFET